MIWSGDHNFVTAVNEYTHALNSRAPREQRENRGSKEPLKSQKNTVPVPEINQEFNLNLTKPLGHHCRHTETCQGQRASKPYSE